MPPQRNNKSQFNHSALHSNKTLIHNNSSIDLFFDGETSNRIHKPNKMKDKLPSKPSSSTPSSTASRYFSSTTEPSSSQSNTLTSSFSSSSLSLSDGDKKTFKNNCRICGFSHPSSLCTNVFCDKCDTIGHEREECPFEDSKIVCDWCLKKGHKGENCTCKKYLVDEEDASITQQLSLITCLKCKKKGHLNCSKPQKSKFNPKFCFVCGQKGHMGLDCTSKSFDQLYREKKELYDPSY